METKTKGQVLADALAAFANEDRQGTAFAFAFGWIGKRAALKVLVGLGVTERDWKNARAEYRQERQSK